MSLVTQFRMTSYKTWHCHCPSRACSEGIEKYSAYHGYYSELVLQFAYRHEHDQGVSNDSPRPSSLNDLRGASFLQSCTTNRSSNCLWNWAWPLAVHQFCRGSFVCSLWPPCMPSGADWTATNPSTLGQQYFRGGHVCWTVAGQGVELLPWGICCLPTGLSPW